MHLDPSSAYRRRGIANLLIVMMIGLFALTLALIVASGVAGGFSKDHNTAASNGAFYTAEAAMREGMYQYEHATSTYAGGPFPILNSVDTSTVAVQPLAWPYVNIVGAANGRGSYRTVTETFTTFPEGLAFDHAIYAEYNLAIGGNVTVNGNIFANGDIKFNGNSATINGDAISSSTVTQTGNGGVTDVTGAVVDGANNIPPPSIDIAPYVAAAQASRTYFTSSTAAESYLKNGAQKAVVVVDDPSNKTNLQNGTDLTGSLVVEGDLNLTGGTYTATGTYAAIVVFGNLSISGDPKINGIIYTTGQVSVGHGGATVTGAIISTSGVDTTSLNGTLTVNFDPTIAANWQNLTGLATTSTAIPEPVQWSED